MKETTNNKEKRDEEAKGGRGNTYIDEEKQLEISADWKSPTRACDITCKHVIKEEVNNMCEVISYEEEREVDNSND